MGVQEEHGRKLNGKMCKERRFYRPFNYLNDNIKVKSQIQLINDCNCAFASITINLIRRNILDIIKRNLCFKCVLF